MIIIHQVAEQERERGIDRERRIPGGQRGRRGIYIYIEIDRERGRKIILYIYI